MEQIRKSDIVYLRVRPSNSLFYLVNNKVIDDRPKRIGSSVSATNRVLSYGNTLKAIMPQVIGVSYTSPNWDEKVSNYFHSFSKSVDLIGTPIERGWNFNSKEDLLKFEKEVDQIEATYLKDIAGKEGDVKIEADAFAKKYEAYCDLEANKYLYGEPINKVDWILYFYTLFYKRVANREQDVDKSDVIDFYIQDPVLADKRKKSQASIIAKAEKVYFKVIDDNDLIENILIASNSVDATTVGSLDENDKLALLRTLRDTNPYSLITFAEDKKVTEKAFLQRALAAGLIHNIVNTTIYEDTDGNMLGDTEASTLGKIRTDQNLKTRLTAQLGLTKKVTKGSKPDDANIDNSDAK